MVSQSALVSPPAPAASRERLLQAAAAEFAARGFDGAKVDRITRLARVNKAMLYYHFTNKAALYQAILVDLFRSLAASVTDGRRHGGAPEDQVRRFIRTVAAETARRPHFPAIWLREMAEGGRHLDGAILRELGTILGTLEAILSEGRRQGRFGPAHPLVTQMGIVAPVLLFAASAPVRARFQHQMPAGLADVSRDAVIAHVEVSTLAALAAGASSPVSAATARAAAPAAAARRPSRARRRRS